MEGINATPFARLQFKYLKVIVQENDSKDGYKELNSCRKTDKSNADARVTDTYAADSSIYQLPSVKGYYRNSCLRVNLALQETISELLPGGDTKFLNLSC
jgi:hypothetical protein